MLHIREEMDSDFSESFSSLESASMDSFSPSDLEKAGNLKSPKEEKPKINQEKKIRQLRFRYVTEEMLEKYRRISEEEKLYKRQYEEAVFKVYGTLPAEKMSFKMQGKTSGAVHKDG